MDYHVFVDEVREGQSAGPYQIALRPSSRNGGPMATKRYHTREAFVADLRRCLGYTDAGIDRFFATQDRHQTLIHHFLSDEDASYLGWLPEYNN